MAAPTTHPPPRWTRLGSTAAVRAARSVGTGNDGDRTPIRIELLDPEEG